MVALLLSSVTLLSPVLADAEGWVCARLPRRLARRLRDAPITWEMFNLYFSALGLPAFTAQVPQRVWRCLWMDPQPVLMETRANGTPATHADIFRPSLGEVAHGHRAQMPVVVFVHGGIWAYGQKELYRLVGAALADLGCCTFVVCYNRYPMGDCFSQAAEVGRACKWAAAVSSKLGFDAERMLLFGHSSGAHVCALHLLQCALSLPQLSGGEAIVPAAFLGLSSVYDIAEHYRFEAQRGVADISPMRPACGGPGGFAAASPLALAQRLSAGQARALPPFLLCHGEADTTVPALQSRRFAAALEAKGARVRFESLGPVGHADALAELMACRAAPGGAEAAVPLARLVAAALRMGAEARAHGQ